MSLFQSLLRHIPEPSIRLVVVLTLFAAVVVMSFAMLDGSGRDGVGHNGTAVSRAKD
jgi:hypothetical protein